MPNRVSCVIFVPKNVFSKISNFLLLLKEMRVFYLGNAVCGKMVIVSNLGSDLIPEFLFLKNNKINKAEQYVDI
jgi:hypothetical protein